MPSSTRRARAPAWCPRSAGCSRAMRRRGAFEGRRGQRLFRGGVISRRAGGRTLPHREPIGTRRAWASSIAPKTWSCREAGHGIGTVGCRCPGPLNPEAIVQHQLTSRTNAPYNTLMKVPISDFRKNLFQLADKALNGDLVEVTHKGKTIRLVPEAHPSKLDRLTPARILNPNFSPRDHKKASRELLAEMQREWEKDWSEL